MPVARLLPALRDIAIVAVFALSGAATAATATYSVALDTDSNAATGCTIATAGGQLAGIEQVVTAIVDTTTTGATVTRLERQVCSGGVLGAPTTYDAGGWPVGLGNGSGGTAAVETSVPLSLLPGGAAMRATALSTGGGGQDVTATFALVLDPVVSGPGGQIAPVPLSPWLVPPLALCVLLLALWVRRRYPRETGLFVLVAVFAVSGLVWAATVIRDGLVADWAGVPAAVTDPRGDAPADADLLAVFFQQDGSNLYFRFDADVRTVLGNQAPVVSAGSAQTITRPAAAPLAGAATDDGLPNPPGALTTTWSKISGPGTVTFGNANATATTATFSLAGAYVLRLTASDGVLSTTADVGITANDAAEPAGPQIAPIADRTVLAGSRLQVVIQASDSAGGALSYSLPTAPSGAALRPAPLIDWVPSLAQVGTHPITARVADGGGQQASTTFNVTVTAPANTPPLLGAQANQSISLGTAFTRTLSAVDPDAGDALTYSLISGPAGMTLSGTALNWSTSGRTAGDYSVTLRVTDAAGAYDQRTFTVTLQASAAPLAVNDSYTVKPGGTLTVSSPGVLGNDSNPSGGPLTAQKLTDPAKGTLSAFGTDGSFTFVAPASVPAGISLKASKLWGAILSDSTGYAASADLNHDGGADVVLLSFGTPVGFNGKTGARLWTGWDTSATSLGQYCRMYLFGTDFALGDVDGSGNIALVAGTHCDATYAAGVSNRLIGVDTDPAHAVGGAAAVRWVSERLDVQVPLPPSVGAPPVPTYVVNPAENGLANWATPTLAKLTPTGGVKVLTRIPIVGGQFPYDSDGDGSRDKNAGCMAATGSFADQGKSCNVTFILNAATGVKEAVLTAPNPYDQYQTPDWEPMRQTAPVVADLDGDGQVEIVSGTNVFKYDGTTWSLAWQAGLPGVTIFYEPPSVSVADLDGDGKAEVILQAMWYDAALGARRGFLTYRHDGVLLHRFELPTWAVGLPSIADVDGDGVSEILFAARGIVWAYHADGTLVWAAQVPDDTLASNPDDDPAVAHWPRATGDRSGAGAGVQVYDLDLDGVPEVIVVATHRLVIYDGRTGKLRSSVHNNAFSRNHVVPLVVDANGDGHADIISAAGNSGVCGGCPDSNTLAFSGVDSNWAPAPLAQNQVNFNPWAVTGGGTIVYDGGVHRSFRTHRQLGTVVDPRTRDTTSFTYAAAGPGGTSAPATVNLSIVPQNSPPVITSTPPTALHVVLQGGAYPTFLYQIAATDPDVGDTVRYELVYSSVDTAYFPQATVDPVTGVMRMYTGPCGSFGAPCDFGPMPFIVAAVDSFGARTEQGFVVDVTSQSRTVPAVVWQLVDPARAAVIGAGLRPRVNEVFSAQAAGTVVAQSPSAGTVVARSATVLLSVSKGPQPVTMPFVVGQQLVNAYALLADLGLSVNVATAFSTTVPAGEIMAQSPAFGTLLIPATAPPVDLTVSAGGSLPLPIVSIVLEPGPGPFLRLAGEALQFRAVAILTDGTSADVSLKAAWLSSAPATASVSPTGLAKAVASGITNISATLGGKTGQVTLNVASRVIDNTPPLAVITAPADGAVVSGPVDIIGTASDANFLRYQLAYALAGDENYTSIGEGTTTVTNGVLGKFDPTVLLNDLYTVRLTVFDRDDNQTQATTTVQVEGKRKIGAFALSYTDLNLATPGVPVTVNRAYDSRVKTQGDFGIGWKLGVQTLTLRTNRVLGTGWVRNVSGITVSLVPTTEHLLSLTLSDGTVEQFDLQVSPTSNVGSLDFTTVTGLVPRPGTLGKLEYLGNPDLLIVNDGVGVVLVEEGTLNTFDPRRFRYTTIDGMQIEIDRPDGVRKVIDRNGNTVSYGPAGIIHSNGQSILFNRDAKGRVTQIIEPNGGTHSYEYDGNGDLSSHTDPAGGRSRYKYDRLHNLIDISDASGLGGVRSEFDESGRLIAIIDAAGRRVAFDHDLPGNLETITDRRGNVVRASYDADGNVTHRVAAVTIDGVLVNASTDKTYDSLGNETSRIDPDGRRVTEVFDGLVPLSQVVDPAGLNLTTTFSYTSKKDIAHVSDAGGRSFDFTYDAKGNLTSASMPVIGTTTAGVNAQGQATQRTDALGNRVELTYDGRGRAIREETYDAASTLLRRVDHAYDENGNVVRDTLHRTVSGVLTPLVTRYEYDPANRLVRAIDPDGNSSRIEYDAAGRVTARIDALGRRTTSGYDALGRLTRTTYPDGTFETVAYDANNNVLQETDRAGRTVSYAYDELNRRVAVTMPGGAVRRTVYSAGGLVTATIDERGNRTDMEYDAAGRLIRSTLPEVIDGLTGNPARPVVQRTYSALGATTSLTDPKGRVTSFSYDGESRPTEQTWADGTKVKQTYDALGRRSSAINEENQVTSWSYDALGRTVAAQGQKGDATYSYDEAGNLIASTDALGRTTRYTYDLLNRVTEQRYPNGDTQKQAYDAVGNLVARTDGLGRTTTFVHDVMNRVVRKNLPGGQSVLYTYEPDGQLATITDYRGITTYSYDARGRLVSIVHPGGETVSYTRSNDDLLTRITSPTGQVDYAYDALARLTSVTAPEGATTLVYDLANKPVRVTAPNGIVAERVFDLRNRPISITHRTSGGSVLASFLNGWSPAGRRAQVTEADGSLEQFGYDARGRLTTYARTGTNPRTASYVYDAVGNRVQGVVDGVTRNYTYDVNDRLVSDDVDTFAWDGNGNLASRSGSGGTTSYGYTPENRLATLTSPTGTTQYGYDDLGNRVQKSAAGGTTRYLVDSVNPTGFAQVLEERDGAGAVQARYSYGTSLLAMERGGARSFYMRDAGGSVRALADASGAVTDRYAFDAYGKPIAATGATENPYRYAGERVDVESGFYDLRARQYDPSAGRFTTRDPFGGRIQTPVSQHRYLYAYDDPVNYVDPAGTEGLLVDVLAAMASFGDMVKAYQPQISASCAAMTSAQAVADVVFASSAFITAIVGTQFLQSDDPPKGTKVGFAGGAEVPIIAVKNPKPQAGYIEKIYVSAVEEKRKAGIKFGVDITGGKDAGGMGSSFEGKILAPPLTVTGQGSGKQTLWQHDYKACAVADWGKAKIDLSMKASAGISDDKGLAGSFGADYTFKFEMFQGKLGISLPLVGASLTGSEKSGLVFDLAVMGIGITMPLSGHH